MTETNKGKAASLTGNLLARKGTATPAGFTRLLPGEDDIATPIDVAPQDVTPPVPADPDQPSLDLGEGTRDLEGSDEGWAPLSQIVIRPHPFTSHDEEPGAEPILVPTSGPVHDVGVEPSLSMDAEHLDEDRREDPTLETPRVPPVQHVNEPILVVASQAHSANEELAGEAEKTEEPEETEVFVAPTLGPPASEIDIGARTGAPVEPSLGLQAPLSQEPPMQANGRSDGDLEPVITRQVDRAPVVAPEEERKAPPAPIILPKPPPAARPPVARRAEPDKSAKSNVVPPIRIGELQAQARVIPTRSRRRGWAAPVVFAVLALAVFLGVTWQAYRSSRDSGGVVSTVGPDGEPTIWATVDELGYAVSQIFSAVTGGNGSGDVEENKLASASDEVTPSPTFVPVGPIGSAESDVASVDQDADDGDVLTAEGEAAEPVPAPEVAVAAVPEPLPAPPVPEPPVAEVVAEVVEALPVGVTAPPAPPLTIENPAAAVTEAVTVGREEVDTAITLEPLETADVAVAAGEPAGEADRQTTAPQSTPPVAELAALPTADNVVNEDGGEIALEGAGVPVLKPVSRQPQQALGGAAALGTSEGGTVSTDGYAVQLSSLKTRAQAEREFERLRGDYPALLEEVELVVSEGSVSNRGIFFRVLTSRFEDSGEAQILCRSLRDKGQDCLVVRR